MASSPDVAQLLVEGKNDQHVIWALCETHEVPEVFKVITPQDGGIDALLSGLPLRLQQESLQTLGVVVDADDNPKARWDSIVSTLDTLGYQNLPSQVVENGTIVDDLLLPRVGVWIMPDNQVAGMLEDFVSYLVPEEDSLLEIVDNTLAEIESRQIQEYSLTHRAKARIHTWLAWQETPGQPMGQAITARVLQHDQPIAQTFVAWLNRLFVEEE